MMEAAVSAEETAAANESQADTDAESPEDIQRTRDLSHKKRFWKKDWREALRFPFAIYTTLIFRVAAIEAGISSSSSSLDSES